MLFSISLDQLYEEGKHEEVKQTLEKMAKGLIAKVNANSSAKEELLNDLLEAGIATIIKYFQEGVDGLVYVSMRNHMYNMLRKQGKQQQNEVLMRDVMTFDQPEDLALDTQVADAVDASVKVRELLKNPKLTQNQLYVLNTILECQGRLDIARNKLGMTSNSMSSFLYHVRKKLRQDAK